MRIYTSYFYQLRFFQPYMVPISTAHSDPKWYHNNSYDKNVVFVDKRGIINGLRILPLVPDDTCLNLCRGRENCGGDATDPDSCAFLRNYLIQLRKIDFNQFIENLKLHIDSVSARFGINREPIVVIMVHEAEANPCSERVAIQRWFSENGMKVVELRPKIFQEGI